MLDTLIRKNLEQNLILKNLENKFNFRSKTRLEINFDKDIFKETKFKDLNTIFNFFLLKVINLF